MEEKYKVTEEVALNDVIEFLEYHFEKKQEAEKVKEEYPDVIEAVMLGILVFDEDQKPTYTLKKPIKSDKGEIMLESITFKTRMLVSDEERLAKGVDFKMDKLKFINRVRAFFISQPVAMLDKFSKFDFRVIDQVSSVFQ